jgi:hypothetical protein
MCVLTCPPEVRVVSNTKAFQSPMDVPPPPRNLTTRIKAKLRTTRSPSSRTHQTPPPTKARGSQGAVAFLLPHTDVRNKSKNHHSSDPVVSATSKLIFCSHHQRCGIAPRFLTPCSHLPRIGRVATYTAIVCRQISIYSPMVRNPHSSSTSSEFG